MDASFQKGESDIKFKKIKLSLLSALLLFGVVSSPIAAATNDSTTSEAKQPEVNKIGENEHEIFYEKNGEKYKEIVYVYDSEKGDTKTKLFKLNKHGEYVFVSKSVTKIENNDLVIETTKDGKKEVKTIELPENSKTEELKKTNDLVSPMTIPGDKMTPWIPVRDSGGSSYDVTGLTAGGIATLIKNSKLIRVTGYGVLLTVATEIITAGINAPYMHVEREMKYFKDTRIPAAIREKTTTWETYHKIDFIKSTEDLQYVN